MLKTGDRKKRHQKQIAIVICKKKKDEKEISNRRTVLLHDSKELDDDLGGRTDENLALASLLGVVHGVKRIVEDGGLDHFGGLVESRFSNRNV